MAMMECPRCGFTQPKDRYCANCGLDVEVYEPASIPVGQKIAKDPRLYIFGALALILGIGYFIYQAQNQVGTNMDVASEFIDPDSLDSTSLPPPETATELEGAAPVESTAPPANNSAIHARAKKTVALEDTTKASETLQAEMNAKPAETPAAAPEESAPAAALPSQIQVQFFEFPQAALPMATEHSQLMREGEQYRVLLHQEPQELISWLKRGRQLPGSQSQPLKEGARIVATYPLDSGGGQRNPDAGLKIEVIVEDATPLGYSLGVRGTYHGLSNPQIPVSLSTRATLSPGTSLLIFGLVGLPEEGEEVTPPPSSPLVILDSMDFAQKLSEFVIVIQMR